VGPTPDLEVLEEGIYSCPLPGFKTPTLHPVAQSPYTTSAPNYSFILVKVDAFKWGVVRRF
jgi:hypothetical protein